VLLLLAHRSDPSADPTAFERALGAESAERLTVGPLSVGGLHRLLRDRLRRPFARQTLLRIHERSGGNPFFALELARVVDADGDPAAPLVVPGTLDELLRARISGLPGATREALALASALGTVPQPLLERAGVAREALDPAVAAEVVELDGQTIRFTHPLFSSILYRDLGAARLEVHARIARIVDDPLLRASLSAFDDKPGSAWRVSSTPPPCRRGSRRVWRPPSRQQSVAADAACRRGRSGAPGRSRASRCGHGRGDDRGRSAGRRRDQVAACRGSHPLAELETVDRAVAR
jgi:hypothetical protein